MSSERPEPDLTGKLASYMAEARARELPDKIVQAAKHHILDTVAAMVSGAQLKPGQVTIAYTRTLGGAPEAQVVGSDVVTSAVNAALANGMLAHADETDDMELGTKAHPGCSVVPAALSMAEREGSSGAEFIRAVTLGYDLCCRILRALNLELLWKMHRSDQDIHAIGATFGSAAAAGSLAKLNADQMRYLLSYAAQQASGIGTGVRDTEHIEKAFHFGGMNARNGVCSATMVQAGFTGVWDVLEGEYNFLDTFSVAPKPDYLVEGLGTLFDVANTSIKPFPAGYPIQSTLDALFTIMRNHNIGAEDVEQLVARLPEDAARVVNKREMPEINVQHVLAIALLDGAVTFASTHSYERMKDPVVLRVKARIHLHPDPQLVDPEAPRQAIIEVTTRDGRKLRHHTKHAPGTPQNPLSEEGIKAKARDLMRPVLGPARTEELIRKLLGLESVGDVRELRPLLAR